MPHPTPAPPWGREEDNLRNMWKRRGREDEAGEVMMMVVTMMMMTMMMTMTMRMRMMRIVLATPPGPVGELAMPPNIRVRRAAQLKKPSDKRPRISHGFSHFHCLIASPYAFRAFTLSPCVVFILAE